MAANWMVTVENRQALAWHVNEELTVVTGIRRRPGVPVSGAFVLWKGGDDVNLLTALRLIMALVKVLKVNIVDLAEAYSDLATCQATFDKLIKLAGSEKVVH